MPGTRVPQPQGVVGDIDEVPDAACTGHLVRHGRVACSLLTEQLPAFGGLASRKSQIPFTATGGRCDTIPRFGATYLRARGLGTGP